MPAVKFLVFHLLTSPSKNQSKNTLIMVLVHRDILPFEYIQSVSQSHTVWAIPKRLIELIFIRILIQNLVHMLPRVQFTSVQI